MPSSPPKLIPRATIYITPATDTWSDMDDVLRACKGKPVIIKGKTLDLNGCQINGRKLPQPKDDQDESSAPLRINIPGFTLKNGSADRIPGGLVMRKKGVTVQKLIFLNIGEDGVSNVMDDSENMSILSCTFYGARDKSIQMNDGRGLTLEDNEVHGGETGIRIQKTGSKYKTLRTRSIKKNRLLGCHTGFNISGGITVIDAGNTFENVDLHWKVNGATLKPAA